MGNPLIFTNVKFQTASFPTENGKVETFMFFKIFKGDDPIRDPNYVVEDYVPVNHILKDGSVEVDRNDRRPYHVILRQKMSIQLSELFFLGKAIKLWPFIKDETVINPNLIIDKIRQEIENLPETEEFLGSSKNITNLQDESDNQNELDPNSMDLSS